MKRQIVVAMALGTLIVVSARSQTKDLFGLLLMGSPSSIQAAIDKGADVNARDVFGMTPLISALHWPGPRDEVIDILIKAGADVNAADKTGKTSLMYAAANADSSVIVALASAGAQVNAKDNGGKTAAMYAAKERQNLMVISALIKAGADLNAQDEDGMTSLMYAARESEDPKLVTMLLAAGADTLTQDKDGKTALMWAIDDNRNPDVISLLVKPGADIQARDKDGKTPLAWAVYQARDAGVITSLLKEGADIETRNKKGMTPLNVAADSDHPSLELISFLLKAGANLETRNDVGTTPLMHALDKTNPIPELIAALLKSGANLGARDKDGESPLMYAVEKNQNPVIVSMLLAAGADYSAQDNSGETALMYAIENKQKTEVISLLVRAGVDLEARDKHGATALMIAADKNESTPVITMLLKAGADVKAFDNDGETALMHAARNPHPELIAALLKAGADVDARENNGRTALIIAAENNKTLEATMTLLKAGANVNAKDTHGDTALMVAAKWNESSVVSALLDAGADGYAKNVYRETALDQASSGNRELLFGILSKPFFELVQKGTAGEVQDAINKRADVNAKNRDGATPLMYAAQSSRKPEVISTLLKAGADLNARDKTGMTPLLYAAARNQSAETLAAILKAGADMKAHDKDGLTALMLAARLNQNPEVVITLLDAGADVDIKDQSGKTALDYAQKSVPLNSTAAYWRLYETSDKGIAAFFELARNGTPQELQDAINKGARLNAANTQGVTPLMLAAGSNPDPEAVTVLLNASADVNAKDKGGAYAFDYARNNEKLNGTVAFWRLWETSERGKENFVALVKKGTPRQVQDEIDRGADVKGGDKAGRTPLMLAAENNPDPDMITTLLRAGADMMARDARGATPSMYAAGHNGNPQVIGALLPPGADLAVRDNEGKTLLIWACANNQNPAVVSLLLKAGADVNAKDSKDDTALIGAARGNAKPEAISLLIAAGADVNAQARNGDTALIAAAAWVTPDPQVVVLLLKAGADVNARDNDGHTARDIARLNQAAATYELLSLSQSAAAASLALTDPAFDEVYPVFHTYYDAHPLGTVVIRNTSSRPVTGIKVSFQIKEFMADPKTCPAPAQLAAGESMKVALFALFLPTILETTEKTKTQARIDVEYTFGGQVQQQNLVSSIAILDRNATTWTDNRRAAAFVTAKDPAVLTFSKNVSSIVKGRIPGAVNPNLLTAIAYYQTLQLFGLTYSQDPIPTITANGQVVDYIQFPRQTLQYKGGKCSDFSVLYSALLESVGIETAFITIPGHIFMAFSLGLAPDDARKVFSRPGELIFSSGKSWIPLEVTESGGLLRAWQDGAREWRDNLSHDQAILYPLHDAWQIYEPVRLPGAEAAVNLPPAEKIIAAYQQEAFRFIDQELFPRIAALESQIKEAKDPRKSINELGILYARYGHYDEAQQQFKKLLEKENYVPALLNMGNVLFLGDQQDKALEYYNRAYAKDPTNPKVLLAVARANHDLENYGIVKKVFAELKKSDPDLAQQFAYLDLKGEEATRAADASGMSGIVVWGD